MPKVKSLRLQIQDVLIMLRDKLSQAEVELKSGDGEEAASRMHEAKELLSRAHELTKQISN